MLLKKILLASMCFMALTGQTLADPLSEAVRVYDTGDYEQAVKLFTPLAEKGNAEAQYVLGIMYRAGRGVPQDFKKAKKWYLLSAEQGHPIAPFYLGWIYAKGKGVSKDVVRGYMWLNIAIANTPDADERKKEFIVDRDSLAASMTADQIAKAQALSKKCMSKKFKGC